MLGYNVDYDGHIYNRDNQIKLDVSGMDALGWSYYILKTNISDALDNLDDVNKAEKISGVNTCARNVTILKIKLNAQNEVDNVCNDNVSG
jgi:virulence-associated protein VapD